MGKLILLMDNLVTKGANATYCASGCLGKVAASVNVFVITHFAKSDKPPISNEGFKDYPDEER